ncbi:MAG: hypothetical protein ROW48_07990 [Bellilinea sp.]|jgi:hypothetical protein
MSEIICPYCGKPNTPDVIQCRWCQKFLFGETPASSTPDQDTDNDWLNSLRSDSEPPPEDESSPDESAVPADEQEIPDWLARIRQRSHEDADNDTPPEDSASSDEELPAWLQEIQIPAPPQSETSQAAELPEDIPLPDWLAAAESPLPSAQDVLPDTLYVSGAEDGDGPLDHGELPEWLTTAPQSGLTPTGSGSSLAPPEEDEQPATDTPPIEEETPDWLKAFDLQEADAIQTNETPALVDDDWLKAFGTFNEPATDEAEDTPAFTPIDTGALQPAELPTESDAHEAETILPATTGEDWLASLQPAEAPAASDPTSGSPQGSGQEWLSSFDDLAEEPQPMADLPSGEEWLKSFEPLPSEEEVPASAQFEAEIPVLDTTGLPGEDSDQMSPSDRLYSAELSRLDDLESSAAFSLQPGEPPALEDDAEATPFISDELPDWFSDDQLLETLQEGETQAVESETSLEPAELPGWLQAMRPLEAVAPGRLGSDADQRIETSGPLSGYQSVLPGEALVTQYSKPGIYSGRLNVLEKQRAYANMLENLIADEKRSQPAPAERSVAPRLLARMLVSGLVTLVILAFLVGGFTTTSLPGLYAPESVAFFNQIQSISSATGSSPVLLAVDFEPALAGEIRAAAQPVLEDLISGGVATVIVSTNPTGAALMEDALISANGFAPDSMINMGYLPGGSSALAALASQPMLAAPTDRDGAFAWDRPPLQGITRLSEFAAVLLITDNTDTSRAWIEQISPALGETPLLVIASNQAAPMIQPYIQSRQVAGMLAGLPGLAAYQQLSGNALTQAGYWGAYQAGLILIVVLILLGSLFFIARQLLFKPKSEKRN